MTDRICKIVGQVLGVSAETIHLDDAPETLPKWDSLAHINLMLALESEYDVTFTPEDMATMASIRSICDILARKGIEIAIPD